MPKATSQYYKNAAGNKDLVIVLLGWAGAKSHISDKYAQLYQKKGYDTISFTANLSARAWGKLKYTREVSSLVHNVQEALANRKLAFHCFSMNGVFTLCSLQLQHPELHVLKNTQGIIFDSAPARFDFNAIVTYMKVLDYSNAHRIANFDWKAALGYKIEKIGQVVAVAKYFVTLERNRLFGWDSSYMDSFDFLLSCPDMPHFLSFVYSDADDVCKSEAIAEFAMLQRKRGRHVEELHFKDSEHVQHWRRYPQEYSQLMERFLKQIRPQAKL